MDADKLKKINRALKIAVNLVKPEQAGFKELLEAKDIVEKELQRPVPQTPKSPPPPKPSATRGKFYGYDCSSIRAGQTCRMRFPWAMEVWCTNCMISRFGEEEF